ncbi:hypothetical protein [Mobiluncus mulieris]
MKHKRVFQAVATGVAIAALGMTLSGCEAKPGVAAVSQAGEITEAELGQVSAELAQISLVDRATVLQSLLVLKHGGKEALKHCPTWEDIPVKDFEIPAGTELSVQTKNVLTLSLCQAAANPAVAQNLGLPVTNPKTAAFLNTIFNSLGDPGVERSAREQYGLSILEQQIQQRQAQPRMATPQE